MTRRGLASGLLALPVLGRGPTAHASSVDGRGVTNDDIRAGFAALDEAPIRMSDGQPFSIDQYRGRALLVNFWAFWCGNCLGEFRSMRLLQGAARGPGQFAVVLVSLAQNWERDRAMAARLALPFPLAVYAAPASAADNAREATVLLGNVEGHQVRYGLPVSYLANRAGRVVFCSTGGTDWVSQPVMHNAAVALQ